MTTGTVQIRRTHLFDDEKLCGRLPTHSCHETLLDCKQKRKILPIHFGDLFFNCERTVTSIPRAHSFKPCRIIVVARDELFYRKLENGTFGHGYWFYRRARGQHLYISQEYSTPNLEGVVVLHKLCHLEVGLGGSVEGMGTQ